MLVHVSAISAWEKCMLVHGSPPLFSGPFSLWGPGKKLLYIYIIYNQYTKIHFWKPFYCEIDHVVTKTWLLFHQQWLFVQFESEIHEPLFYSTTQNGGWLVLNFWSFDLELNSILNIWFWIDFKQKMVTKVTKTWFIQHFLNQQFDMSFVNSVHSVCIYSSEV